MAERIGTCKDCGTRFKIPPTFTATIATCKKCHEPAFQALMGTIHESLTRPEVALSQGCGGCHVGGLTHASHTGGLLAIWPVATSPMQNLIWTAGLAALGALALWLAIRRSWI